MGGLRRLPAEERFSVQRMMTGYMMIGVLMNPKLDGISLLIVL